MKNKLKPVVVSTNKTKITTIPIPKITIPKIVKNIISRKRAYELMSTSKGRFFTATFITKKGTKRVINGQFLKSQKDLMLGYVKVKEACKHNTGDCIRNINLQTLKKLCIGGKCNIVR